jgi:hypothetical protein
VTVAPDRLTGDDLVGDEDGDVELLGDLDEARHHAAELLLAVGELAAARVVDAEERRDRVDDQQLVVVSVAPLFISFPWVRWTVVT